MEGKTRVVKTVVRNQDGEFLALKDSKKDQWELPGGKILRDEDRFQASGRELEEETALKAKDFEDLVRIELENGEHINCFVVYTENFSGEVELSDEHSEYRWIKTGELTELDWHRNAEYNLPVLRYIHSYTEKSGNYSQGDRIEVVKLLIRNSKGKFLVVKKNSKEKVSGGEKYSLYGRMSGKWELPGGKFKNSSDRFSASKREIKEELGLELANLQDVVREEIEEENAVNTWIVFTDDFSGEINLSKEHEEHRWVDPDEYAEMDWHQDAGYGLPPMRYLEDYLG